MKIVATKDTHNAILQHLRDAKINTVNPKIDDLISAFMMGENFGWVVAREEAIRELKQAPGIVKSV